MKAKEKREEGEKYSAVDLDLRGFNYSSESKYV